MAKKINRNLNSQSGFTLIEVMIALTIFAVFSAAYMTSQGYILSDSSRFDEELEIHEVCENTLNRILVSPPDLTESLLVAPDIKAVEGYKDYESKIEWKQLKLPDLEKIQGKSEKSEEKSENKSIETQVFNKISENIKNMVWQVKVTITHKTTGYSYSLAGIVHNQRAKVNLNL